MMKLALAIGALALSSCEDAGRANHSPNGRFQMIQSGNARNAVYVLDTATGHIWLCAETPDASLVAKCGLSQQTAQIGDDGLAI